MPSEHDETVYATITTDISDVLRLLAKRYSRPEIVEATGLNASTVRNYIERMEDLTKLDQRGLRDWWAEHEADYLRWQIRRLGHDPTELVP